MEYRINMLEDDQTLFCVAFFILKFAFAENGSSEKCTLFSTLLLPIPFASTLFQHNICLSTHFFISFSFAKPREIVCVCIYVYAFHSQRSHKVHIKKTHASTLTHIL